MKIREWSQLAKELRELSRDICCENGCKGDNHNCESYAYIAKDGYLSDVCLSDYWQGWGSEDIASHGQCAAIPMPWYGSGKELKDAVENDTWE